MNPSICCLKPLYLGHSDVSSDLGSNQKNENCSNSKSSSAATNSTKSLNYFAIVATSTASSVPVSPSCSLCCYHTPCWPPDFVSIHFISRRSRSVSHFHTIAYMAMALLDCSGETKPLLAFGCSLIKSFLTCVSGLKQF